MKKLTKKLKINAADKSDYDVGYGRPPKSAQFKPGKSGNLKGRPKGAKNKRPALNQDRLKDIILGEAYRTVKVRDGDKQATVPVAQAVMRSISLNAAKGQVSAQKLFSELLSTTEAAEKQDLEDCLIAAIDYKSYWEAELERRHVLKQVGLEPYPHPDHVLINFRTGEVEIVGPVSRHHRRQLEELIARKAGYLEDLADAERELETDPNHEYRDLLEQDIARDRKMLDYIAAAERMLEGRRI